MVQRHRLINAVRYPDPSEPPRGPLLRPVTLTDVLQRHPEWARRLRETLFARMDGLAPPSFPLLDYCVRCDYEFVPNPRLSSRLCFACREHDHRKREALRQRLLEYDRNRPLKDSRRDRRRVRELPEGDDHDG